MKIVIAVLFLTASMIAYCEENPIEIEHDSESNIFEVQEWVNSFSGKTESQLKKIFPNKKPVRSKWEFAKRKELILTYEHQNTELALYFLNKDVISTSLQFISE